VFCRPLARIRGSILSRVSLICGISIAAACAASASNPTLKGYVRDENDAPVQGARIHSALLRARLD